MYIHKEELQVPPEGLSLQGLFWILQEASGHHSAALGFAEADMKALGVMWVVIRYGFKAERAIRPGEMLHLETWPGRERHGMCPRFYRIFDAEGLPLLSGTALWAVVDRQSRQMVTPRERGVTIDPLVTGDEPPLPGTVRRPAVDQAADFTVPADYLDGNGHMNNTRYFDLAERCAGLSTRERGLKEITAEFLEEALLGDALTVRWGLDGACATVVGTRGDTTIFRMKISTFA